MFVFIGTESPLLTALSIASILFTVVFGAAGPEGWGLSRILEENLPLARLFLADAPEWAFPLAAVGVASLIIASIGIFALRAHEHGGIFAHAAAPEANATPRLSVEAVARLLHALPIEVWRPATAELSIGELKARLLHRNMSHQVASALDKTELVHALQAAPSETTCAICYEDYADGEDVVRVLNCCHYFHCECIDKWLLQAGGSTRAPACPLCNASLIAEDARRKSPTPERRRAPR
jgi:hypothetical protein